MTCEEYSELLTAYSDGEASPEEVLRVEDHLASCTECTEIVRSLRAVRAAGSESDVALFDRHPASEDLSRYVVLDAGISTSRLAGVAAHVRSCPLCSHEADLARRAVRDADSVLARVRALLSPGAKLWIPAPLPAALVAAVVLLAVPAYQGLRRAPDPWAGGALPMVLLEAETRGATLREVIVDPRSPFTLVLVEVDSPSASWSETLTVRLLDHDGRELWRHAADVSTAYDADHGLISLVAPTHVLRSGVHVLELRPGANEDARALRFRVLLRE